MKIFLSFYLCSSSKGLPTKDNTLSLGFCAIFKATLLEILVCYDQNIYNSGSLSATSSPLRSVARVSEMKKDFIFGIPRISFRIPLSLILFPLISTETKKGMLLAITLQVRHDILLFRISNSFRFLKLESLGICSITSLSEMFLLLNDTTLELWVTLTFCHS